MHAGIRARLVQAAPEAGKLTPILYGGSVTPENAAPLFAEADIDGASLNAQSFYSIGEALSAARP